ncbi:MAG: electron transport complex subunit E [Gammaproteobacteria bacterium]|jgi:electron transport complex protein RnfE|nr:electron transport complex subunit E [Gammaproteobacteria bacterium]MBT3722798.1 electron transport complex subunit E [Gammaproteobacteria bacterium]MBT4076623.1 electron transport complex subunit E [Gammaproteobacteria bacterium]MBT4193455.1 electron transport complex subunit E [Gammaproteobacteria bacterium]MBT4450372.1 electron transport complex subunit E [Gammaproteobacteria bacterium]
MSSTPGEIARSGLWKNNVALVQLLGLCPLLAVTSTTINGIGLGLATLITLVLSNSLISAIRNVVRNEVRLPVFVLIIASIVTIIELTMQAYFYDLYLVLGIFIPLIVTNCSIIGRAEGFASKNPIAVSALDGFMMGLGFLIVLTLLGMFREIIGFGTLLANANLMFGEGASALKLTLNEEYGGFLLAILPPGAFFGLALLIVAKNLIETRFYKAPTVKNTDAEPATT